MPLSAGLRLGPYEIVAPIGAGGMGEVYRAIDTRLGRTVALKILPSNIARSPEMRERFEREARTISNLNDSNICTLHDIGEQDGTFYLVMEHLEGETLAARLTRGALSDEETIRYATQIANALHRAHEQGIVHRDLKPANIMLTKSGAKLLDFGLAKLADMNVAGGDDVTRRDPLTSEGTVLGTLAYMAPEQLLAEKIDARTDIFAFGAVMYEMATGRRAFDAPSRVRLMTSILEEQPTPVSDLRPLSAPVIDRVVRIALAKKPEDRWHSARDIAFVLQSPNTGPTARLPVARRTGWMMVGGLAALLLAALIAAGVLLRRSPPAAAQANIRSLLVAAPEITVGQFGAIALSPDGRSIAFLAEDGDSERLHVQRLDGTSHEVVAAGAHPRFPFWSPDSRYVGFFLIDEEKRIKKFDTVTKSVQSVTDIDGIGGRATWGSKGDILFISGPNGVVQRLAADGNAATPLTKLDARQGEIGHVWPAFLPDGDHFFYLALTSREGQALGKNLYVSSVSAPEKRKLVAQNASNAAFVAPHHLVFAREQNLVVQRFDPVRLDISGAAVPLVPEPMTFDANAGLAEFTVSANGLLAYTAIGVQKTRLVLADRRGQITRPLTEVGSFLYPSISPDGTRVSVTRRLPESRANGVVVYDVADGSTVRVTSEAADYDFPLWSPDGRSIAYGSNRRSLREICVRPARGGEEQLLLSAGREDVPVDWSTDGRYILFRRLDARTFYDLWALPLEAGRKPFPVVTSPAAEQQAEISPDGRWLAYTAAEGATVQLFVTPFPDGGQPQRIAAGMQPHWRSDGRELFFIAPDLRLTTIPFDDGKPAGKAQSLFEILSRQTTPFGRVYDVFPDGQQFLLREALDEEMPRVVLIQGAFTARDQ
ncbi:MAG TPA: protein kinase [Thermoanaerobaculia bacterium]|nr:protein kinase [Thermoanaerobaculia bacterium]